MALTQELTLKYRLTVVVVMQFVLIALDQWTKNLAVEKLAGQASHSFLGGLFQLVYAENPGAFLGMGGTWSREIRFVIFAVLVIVGLGAMLWYVLKKDVTRSNLIAYSFILAGGFGNLWDRVSHEKGHVIDFMLIDIWGPLRTGVFNVADMAIVAGVLMALLGEYYFDRRSTISAK